MAAAELLGYPADFPTADERIAIARGRRAHEKGDVISLEQWRHDMELDTH